MTALADLLGVVAADELCPQTPDDNPRRGDVDAIRESIDELQWAGVLVVNRRGNVIVHGNHRYHAGVAEGMTEFPVFWVDLDDAAARRLAIALNRHADQAGWDPGILLDQLVEIRDDGLLAGTGFATDDLDKMFVALEPLPPPPEHPQNAGQVQVRIGTVAFSVDREDWDAYERDLIAECGNNRDAQVASIRQALSL